MALGCVAVVVSRKESDSDSGRLGGKKGSNVAIKFNGCDFQSSDHRLSKERAMWYVEGVFMENNKSHNADEHGNN